jgi:hypothetical protein
MLHATPIARVEPGAKAESRAESCVMRDNNSSSLFRNPFSVRIFGAWRRYWSGAKRAAPWL